MGSCISGKPESEIEVNRQAYKKIAHGSHYDEQPQRIMIAFSRTGCCSRLDECMVGQQRYLGRFPAIQGTFQANIRTRLIRDRKLTNSWGASIFFPYDRLEPCLYRRGYAWIPQSEIGRLLNQRGFIPVDNFLLRNNTRSRINLQVHDEIALSTCPEEAWDVLRFVQECLAVEREYGGEAPSIRIEKRYHTKTCLHRICLSKEQFQEVHEAMENREFSKASKELFVMDQNAISSEDIKRLEDVGYVVIEKAAGGTFATPMTRDELLTSTPNSQPKPNS